MNDEVARKAAMHQALNRAHVRAYEHVQALEGSMDYSDICLCQREFDHDAGHWVKPCVYPACSTPEGERQVAISRGEIDPLADTEQVSAAGEGGTATAAPDVSQLG